MGARAPKEAPNTGTATTEAPKTDAPKNEPPAEPQAQAPSSTPDGFKIGGFTFKPGGRIKLDIIRDFNPIGSEDSFDPRTIPVDGSEGSNSNLHREGDAPVPRHARSGRGQRAEDVRRDRLLRQQQCPSACARRMAATAAFWPGRPGRPSWTSTTFPTPSTSSRRSPSRQIRQAQAALDAEAGRQGVVVGGGRGQQVDDHGYPSGIAGKAEYPMPDLVTRFRYRPRAARAGLVLSRRARFRPKEGEPTT